MAILEIALVTSGFASLESAEFPESLTLDQAVEYAMKHNPDIRIQEDEIQKVKGQYIQTRASAILSVDLTLQAEHIDNAFASFSEGRTGDQIYNSIEAEQPVYSFGKLGYALEAAQYLLKKQDIELENVKQSIAYQVTSAFYAVLLQDELVNVNQEAVRLAEEHLKRAEIRFEQGVNTQFDVTRAKVELANRKPDFISSKIDLVKARQNFNQLLNLPPRLNVRLTGEMDYIEYNPDMDIIWKIAKDNRMDLKSQIFTVQQKKAQLNLMRSLNRPTITVGGSYRFEFDEYEGLGNSDFETWSANVKLTMPLFDGFRVSGQVKEARANLDQEKINYENLLLSAQIDVEQTVLDIQRQKELVLAAREAIELGEISLKMAKVGYENGRTTTLDVADAELSLKTARINWARAVYDYLVGLAKLRLAAGLDELP